MGISVVKAVFNSRRTGASLSTHLVVQIPIDSVEEGLWIWDPHIKARDRYSSC
jgi:hypothetical protein